MTQNQSDAAPDGPTRKRPAETPLNGEDLSAAQVADYLQRNPDFLVRNPELIEFLLPPDKDRGDGVIDLQRYMVERLRDSVSLATAARDDLVSIGRTNLAAQTRVHTAVLALMDSRSFEHLIETVTTDLPIMLDLDATALGVEQSSHEAPPLRLGGVFQLEPDTVDAVIGPGRAIALRSDIEGDPAIFGAAAGLVRSEALIRLTISPCTPPALLALGSRHPEQFHPGQGTELMSFMAQALEKCVRAWLHLPD